MAGVASVCIRCGSKEHSTRDHDEGKIAGLAPVKKPPPKKAAPPPNPTGKVKHKVCWSAPLRRPGIPDIIEKPLRDRWEAPNVSDPFLTCKMHVNCPCLKCELKKKKLALEALRRQGKA